MTAVTSTHVINSFMNNIYGLVALGAGFAASATTNIAGQALRGGQTRHIWNQRGLEDYFSDRTTNWIRVGAAVAGIAATVACAKKLPIKSVPGIVVLKIIGLAILVDIFLACMYRGKVAGPGSIFASGAATGFFGPYFLGIPGVGVGVIGAMV